jgi:hypothetical protein
MFVVKVGREERRWLEVSGSGVPPSVHCVQFYKKTKVSGVRDSSLSAGVGGGSDYIMVNKPRLASLWKKLGYVNSDVCGNPPPL